MENEVKEPAPKYNNISAEEYLTEEREAFEKHEYYQGEVFAMSGASLRHNKIFSNLFGELAGKLKGKDCRPFGSDLRIHIPKNTLYTYPDISIICGEPNMTDYKFDTATNPSVIIELLSKSTRNYDKGDKFTLYRDIDSLQEYILIDTEKIYVEKHIRNIDKSWPLTDYTSMEDFFSIQTIHLKLSLKDIYSGITF
ncbi:MAG: Uma2 family endonuclease [Ferruginibacter sp.]